jgi:hypothetical protein
MVRAVHRPKRQGARLAGHGGWICPDCAIWNRRGTTVCRQYRYRISEIADVEWTDEPSVQEPTVRVAQESPPTKPVVRPRPPPRGRKGRSGWTPLQWTVIGVVIVLALAILGQFVHPHPAPGDHHSHPGRSTYRDAHRRPGPDRAPTARIHTRSLPDIPTPVAARLERRDSLRVGDRGARRDRRRPAGGPRGGPVDHQHRATRTHLSERHV